MIHVYNTAKDLKDLSDCQLYVAKFGDTYRLTDNRLNGFGDIAESESESELQRYADAKNGTWM